MRIELGLQAVVSDVTYKRFTLNCMLVKLLCVLLLMVSVGNSHAAGAKRKVKKLGPPQLIYRIDDDRYLMLEGYYHCDYGSVYYYNDKTKRRINVDSTYLGATSLLNNFKGRLIWATTQERFIALPSFQLGNCGPRGCRPYIIYQDLQSYPGHEFRLYRSYDIGDYTFDPAESSKDYTLILTDEGFYLHKTVKGQESTDYVSYNTLGSHQPQRQKASYPTKLRTPSGQERITGCDTDLIPEINLEIMAEDQLKDEQRLAEQKQKTEQRANEKKSSPSLRKLHAN